MIRFVMPSRGALGAFLGLVLAATPAAPSHAQVPSQEPLSPAVPDTPPAPGIPSLPAPAVTSQPPAPAVATPAAVAATAPALSREDLEARVRQLESMVNKLSTQMNQAKPAAAGTKPASSTAGGTTAPRGGAAPDAGSAASNVAPSTSGGPSAPGQSLPANPPASARFNSPATLDSVKASAKFGPGFELKTEDNEYIFQFHNLTQFDYRGYGQGGQAPVRDTFVIPRQWWMFSGRISKPIGYFVSFQNGFDTFSMLDVFTDIDFNPKFRMRIGRFKTPFTYEFMVEPIQGLVVPERSIFFNNFGQNRDLGIMAFGRLLNNKLDYATGIFNGTRNGFLAQQDGKKVSAFLNYKPWGDEENTLLENFNVGGSVYAGNSVQTPIPQTFRTVVATTGNQILGVPYLNLNNNVRETGPMAFWDLHAAWFYQQLAVIGEWGSGNQGYSQTGNATHTRVPIESFYVQASYLLTGETRSSIGIVKPLNPVSFGRGNGWSGTGALEPFFRFEYLNIGSQVFNAGFADPNLWTDRVFMTHTGFNWHLTQYVKMYFDWNHAEFAQPVQFAPGRRQKTSDLFMVRFQLYF